MDDLLYNLKIRREYNNIVKYKITNDNYKIEYDIKYSEIDKENLYFYASKIKKDLIYLYDKISMKIFQDSCDLDNIRNNISLYCTIYYKYDSINFGDIKVNNDHTTYTIEYIKKELIDTWKNKQVSYHNLFNILNIIFHDTFTFKLIYKETKYNLYKDSLNTYLQVNSYKKDIDTIQSDDIIDLHKELEKISKKISNEINNGYYYTSSINDLTMNDNYEEVLSVHINQHNHNIHWTKDNDDKLYTTYKIKKEVNINLQKSLLLMFNNITDIKKITEKLYLDENNTKNLSLQSILIYLAGDILDGTSVSSGHYMCMFKCNNKWYLFNPTPTPIPTPITEYENYNEYITNENSKYITGLYYI